MSARTSRRILSRHVSNRLLKGDTEVIAQLAAYLLETKRTSEVDLIVRDVEDALVASGVVIADVTVAHDLDASLKSMIESYVSDMADVRKVYIRTKVDSSVLGGARIRVPGSEFDGTLRRRITKLQAMKV
jgi:F0F1-type ATP synthase delta subunit